MRKPNFFIVGAPRAGTTALYQYLDQHPDVFLPRIKEPHHFGQDLKFAVPRLSFEEYKKLFQSATDQKALGDGSVMYLMSRSAAKEIKERCPDAKIIIMLRHPVDLIISLHRKMLLSGNENIEDLQEALEAEHARKQGKQIPRFGKRISLLFYSDVVRFAPQVQRYLDVFGKENTHIIIFDDFITDTEKAYKNVLVFLNLATHHTPDFKVVNSTKNVRFSFIRDLRLFIQHNSSQTFRRIVHLLTTHNLRYNLNNLTNRIINTDKSINQNDCPLRIQLHETFKHNIFELSHVLDKDLTAWVDKYASNKNIIFVHH